MTKTIEDALNLPRLQDALAAISETDSSIAVDDSVERMTVALKNADPSSLVITRDDEGVDTHEAEMNEVYETAMRAHKELLDLGFNIEAKHAGQMFEPATRMLEIALQASKSKSEQKLKRLKIRMDREKLDHDLRKNQEDGVIDGESVEGFMADRNELMKQIRALKK